MDAAPNPTEAPKPTCPTGAEAEELFDGIVDADPKDLRARIDEFVDEAWRQDEYIDLHYVYEAARVLPADDFEYFVATASCAPVLSGVELYQIVDMLWAQSSDLRWDTQKRVMRLAGYTGDCGDEDLPAAPVVVARSTTSASEAWTAHSIEVPGVDPAEDYLVAVVDPEMLLAQRDTECGLRYFVDDAGLAVLEVSGSKVVH